MARSKATTSACPAWGTITSVHVRSLETLTEAEADADAAGRLRMLVSQFVAWHAHHHVAARISQYELAALTPGHYAEILQLRRQTTDIFRQAVVRGIDEGAFAPVEVHRVVRAMLSLGVDLVRWYRTGGPDSPEQLGDFYAELALGMVASAEGSAASRQKVSNGGSSPDVNCPRTRRSGAPRAG